MRKKERERDEFTYSAILEVMDSAPWFASLRRLL